MIAQTKKKNWSVKRDIAPAAINRKGEDIAVV